MVPAFVASIDIPACRIHPSYPHFMPEDPLKEQREHELTMHVFTISGGLVGVCLTAIGLLRILTHHTQVATVADELLAADAVLFMACCFLSFWSFKTEKTRRRLTLRRIIDSLFMVALFSMVVVCALIAYAVL
jgi:predicted membrane protein